MFIVITEWREHGEALFLVLYVISTVNNWSVQGRYLVILRAVVFDLYVEKMRQMGLYLQ